MTITYSTNFMGPVSIEWYRKNGLVKNIWKKCESELIANIRRLDIDDSYLVEEITTYYAGGRIDIRDDNKYGYDSWDEYAVAPMHGEDWNEFSEWLDKVESEQVIPYHDLISRFEEYYGKKIRWAKELENESQVD